VRLLKISYRSNSERFRINNISERAIFVLKLLSKIKISFEDRSAVLYIGFIQCYYFIEEINFKKSIIFEVRNNEN